MKKLSLLLICTTACLFSGCAQNSSTTNASSEETAVKVVQTGARAAVRQVVGTPVKVAMAAQKVATTVVDKVDGDNNQN